MRISRVSTSAILNNYNRNLSRSEMNVNQARLKVMTGRNYQYASENPGEVAKAYQLRRNYANTEDAVKNIEHLQGLFDNMEGAIMSTNKNLENIKMEVLQGINGATGKDARETYAKSLRQQQENMVLNMNSLYGDRFVFSGKDTASPPFKLENGKLFYRGVDVNTSDPAEKAKLDAFAKEEMFMDIGFGLKEDATGTLIKDTAFNISWPGINVVGYGQNADGVSQNAITLLSDIANELERDPMDTETYGKMMDQLKLSKDKVIDNLTQMGIKSNFLETTKTRHEDSLESINEKLTEIEVANPAEAISDYMWYQYAYSSALKVGTSVIPQSLFDFMQ